MRIGRSYQAFRIILGSLAAIAIVRIYNTDVDSYTTEKGRKLQDDTTITGAKYVYEQAAKSVVYIDCFGIEMSGEDPLPEMSGEDPLPGMKVSNKVLDGSNQRILIAPEARQTALDRKIGNNSGAVPLGSGSGYIWDKQIIVTNNHVVSGCTDIEVSLLSKKDEDEENQKLFPTSVFGRDPAVGKPEEFHWKVVKANLVGADPDSDIAVLKIDVPDDGMTPIKRGDDNLVDTGDECYAIGNPYGLDHTITKGIISAKGRVFTSENGVPMTNLIQTDASINPGNSGGPLLNSQGEMIGMNTMIISESGSSSGIGFAIPISRIKKVANIIIKKGKVSRPQFGVKFGLEIQTYFGISKGALIFDVIGPAAKAGLLPTTIYPDGSVEIGDIITKINNIDVDSDLDAYEIIEGCKPGQVITITVQRWQKDKFVETNLRLKLE